MRKITILLATFMLIIGGYQLQAQNAKFGHVDYAAIMKVMPGIDTAQAAVQLFQTELQEVGEAMATEFQTKQAELEKSAASTNVSPAILKIKQDELMQLYERIQTYTASIESELMAKQTELLKPFQDRLLEAINEVAEEGNYTYLFDVTTLSFYGESTDVTALVKAKLSIE